MQDLALEFGATDIISERGEKGVARIKELTSARIPCWNPWARRNRSCRPSIARAPAGRSAMSACRTASSSMARGCTSPRRACSCGPAQVRRFLPHLMDLVLKRKIEPGKVFDLTLPLADVAEGYRAMDERRAIKTLLRV